MCYSRRIQVKTVRDPSYSLQSDTKYGSNEAAACRKMCPKNTSSSAYTAVRGAFTAGRDDVKHVIVIQQLILISPGGIEREYNSFKLPNKLSCKPYDCSRRFASAQKGPESTGADADTFPREECRMRMERPEREMLTKNNRQTHRQHPQALSMRTPLQTEDAQKCVYQVSKPETRMNIV
ncbi:hypothetical protein DPX16_21136 [Anabarilius grahami]|uniref:Uncharacterized protein n=1 Tax=Anabarilius grahami TaxID=495550 RepID=A0A3N0Z2L0_ANAGA|nr:hypothetical protein DPX16_21136 [Anabarilius grahami]